MRARLCGASAESDAEAAPPGDAKASPPAERAVPSPQMGGWPAMQTHRKGDGSHLTGSAEEEGRGGGAQGVMGRSLRSWKGKMRHFRLWVRQRTLRCVSEVMLGKANQCTSVL